MRLVFWLMLLLLHCGWCAITINVNTVTLSNNYTLTSNVLYSLNMTFAPITVPAASSILMQFTIHYTINASSLSNCKYSITGAAYTTTTCTASYNSQNNQYQVTFPSLYPSTATSQTSLFLQFSITNPQFAATEYINLFIISGSSIATGLISITYDASPLNNCAYTSSNQTTGVNSTRTISFFPSAPVFSGSTFVMTLPPWFGTLSSNPISLSGGSLTCAGLANSDSAVPGCNSNVYQDSTTSIYYQEIDVTGLITSNKVLASAITFTATALRNPPSLAPFGPIIFELKIPDPNSGGALTTSQTCTGIYQTVTSMNAPTSISFIINTTLAISTSYTGRNARLSINNPFPLTGQLKVSFPSSMSMVYVPTTYPVISTSTSLTFSSVQSSDLIGSGTISVPGITVTTPPSSRSFTITINSQAVVGGTVYGIDSSSITLSCLTGTLTATSLVPTVTSVNAVTQYILGFTTANALTAASFVAITFPSTLTATVGSCSTNHTNITCSVLNTTYSQLQVTGAVSKLSAIRVTFPSIKNPKQTQTTSSFQISTYYDAGLDSVVDKISTGITMTSTPNSVVSATVTPASFVTYSLTSFAFNVQLADAIPANGYIQIVFPSTVSFGTVAIVSASFTTTTCTLSLVSFTLSINNCFSSDMTTLATSIVISGIFNPPSLQPTSSFSFNTFGPLGMVNFISTGLTTTMTTPATTTAFSITPLNYTVHSTQQYNLGFTFAVPHQSGDYFTLTLPSSMTISASPTCNGLSGIASVSCVLLNTTAIKVNLNAVPLTVMQIAIFSIRNYDIATSVSYQVYFFDSGNYAMQTTTATAVTYTPAAISTFSLNNNNQIALYENSNITVTLSTPFALDSSFTSALASLTVTPPATFTITANTTCSSFAGTCSIASGSFTVSAVGLSLASQTVTIANIVLPYFATTSTSFSISYIYNSMQVATVSSGVTLSVFCTSPCQRCTSSQTTCASCLPITNTALIYLFTVNSSCLGSCPNTYYIGNGNICQPCNTPCLWCSDSVNCTKCSNTTYLYSSTCLAVCPATYFGNSSNICDSCISPCNNCTSLTSCLSCSINFFTNFTCVTAVNCPAGTYGDVPSKTCTSCTSPCANCFNSATNCTSCVAGFVYFQNTCPVVCPNTYYNSTNICTACVSPCGNCTSASTCTSCALNFFTNFSCVTAANCPAGTYGDIPSKTCSACTSPCANCFNSATNCTSCVAGFVYFQNTCPAVCPSTYYNSSNICTTCVSPCGNCTSASTCISCALNFFTNFTCVTAANCPAGTYGDVPSQTCAACTSPCANCFSSATNCTSCVASFVYYQNACPVVCPSTYYNSSNSCTACVSPCGNCTSASSCISCALNFFSNFSCVTAANCPAGSYGDVPSKTCASCTSPCANCFSSATNCTSCVAGFVFFQNACPSVCPSTYYNSSNTCNACVTPCGNCTSSTNCLSCTSNYLSGTSCVTASSCPAGTYADNSSNICANCPAGCSGCQSSTFCSSCTSFFLFYNFTCVIGCPNNSYQSGSSCIICSSACLTCSGSSSTCTGCLSPSLLYGSVCVSSCPNGTYTTSTSCINCLSTCLTCNSGSTCSTCSGSLFLSGTHCLSTCTTGTFQDSSSNNCSACDPTCLSCSASSSNCTACTPSLVLNTNTCIANCPANYFNISGICKTCSNCLSCTSVTSCTNCLPSYYLFAGVCYSSCPAGAILDALTQTCLQCNASCASCSGTASTCLSCAGSLFLLNGVCVSSCPSGYIASAGTCTAATIGNIIYFPFSITFAVIAVIVLYSKSNHPKTQTATALCGILAFLAWISWFALAISAATADLLLQASALSVILGVSMVGIIASVLLGTVFAIWFRNYFKADKGFSEWINHTNSNLYIFRAVFTLTLFTFPFFRILYCRFFTRNQLSAFFVKGTELLNASSKFAFLHTLLCLFPMLFVSGYVVYIKRQYDQTLINAIDSLLLDILLAILLIIDTNSKDDSYFAQMIQDQPYLKKFAYDELNHSLSSLRDFDDVKKQRHHSQLNQREKESFFREKITIIDNVNKFGQLDVPLPEELGKGRKIKTLPDDLQNLPQFDINQDQIQVVDEDFFFQEEERHRKREQEEQDERLRLEEQQRKRKEKEAEEQRERDREKKRKLMEDDMDEQHSVQFPDLAAIEKVEKKGESLKKSPTHILNNFKKVEDRAIGEKEQKKLQDVAKKNSLNPQFMAQTFGIQKHHNPQLLNSIIDKHFHVDREAVKALFSSSSNPELLQELFSKKSTMSADRLRQLMNDPQSAEIIKHLASAEDGIVSAEIAKMLLQENSKFSEEFVKELLTCGGGVMDAAKLKQLLRDQPDKVAREASLKAMKKLGGDTLQNKEMMKNLLGEQCLLQADNFNRVANQLPKKVLEQLFGTKSHTNDVIISKLLNNKKIDLKNLSTILQDPQLMDELAKALSSGNKQLQENLLNLFKNGEKLDPQLLKEFLTRPGLMERLASHTVDPVFLSNLLKKDAQTDLSLLQRTLQRMSPQQIAQVFQFNPEKNIDFEKIAKLFEFNSKTDPALVAELLDPQIVQHIYNKASSARPEILNKLVEKGKRIDPQSIIKIYGDDAKTGYREGQAANKKYNNTENNFNLSKEDFDDQLGFKKANEVNMSRTDGRMLGFLSPIQVGMQQRNRKYSKNGAEGGRGRQVGMSPNQMDDIDDQQMTEYNYAEGEGQKKEEDQQYEQVEQGGKRRRRKKLKKKPLDDIRLPSQHIYLQRLQAPHQKKKNIRKKKKATSSMQQLQPMNEDNQVYDLDF